MASSAPSFRNGDEHAAVPVIYTDSTRTRIVEFGHIEPHAARDSSAMQARIRTMEQANRPIAIDLPGKGRNYIFYEESGDHPAPLLSVRATRDPRPLPDRGVRALQHLPERRTEPGWVGMAKETAHQLGTPLSSLMAWMELLKDQNPEAITENAQGRGPLGGDHRALQQDRFLA
ncbi:MAG: hypothetical protein IPJ10_10010 [Flavobacteriales bacterium]|nr:hypothetical protein [Flavobacteriales bacterium]